MSQQVAVSALWMLAHDLGKSPTFESASVSPKKNLKRPARLDFNQMVGQAVKRLPFYADFCYDEDSGIYVELFLADKRARNTARAWLKSSGQSYKESREEAEDGTHYLTIGKFKSHNVIHQASDIYETLLFFVIRYLNDHDERFKKAVGKKAKKDED